jgi:predicted nucleic acid-binding protein
VLEVAVAAGCDAIVTYNKRDFKDIERFGLRVLDPKELLTEIGVIE